mmetsp:Transcript_3550/g.7678  ORF Transcript_3550/g.7678 Transcript_3550/m.7678 type:complete len:135 (-) Transcript_3550:4-408(-)
MASKLVMAQSLPKLPYMTHFDYYMLACFGLILATAACNASVHFIQPAELARTVDLVEGSVLLAGWLAFNIIFIVRVNKRLRRIRSRFGPPIEQLPYDLHPAVTKVSADGLIDADSDKRLLQTTRTTPIASDHVV